MSTRKPSRISARKPSLMSTRNAANKMVSASPPPLSTGFNIDATYT